MPGREILSSRDRGRVARLYTGTQGCPWRCSVPLTTTRRARNRSRCPPLATLTSRREAANAGRRALQSGRQGRCWHGDSGWTLRERREPRRAVAVGIWSAGLLAGADHSEWTACQIPSRPSYRASFVLRRWPAGPARDWWTGHGTFDCGLHRLGTGGENLWGMGHRFLAIWGTIPPSCTFFDLLFGRAGRPDAAHCPL